LDFKLSDEQKLFQKTIREFCQKEIKPITEKIDKEEYFPEKLYKKMWSHFTQYHGDWSDVDAAVTKKSELKEYDIFDATAEAGYIDKGDPVVVTGYQTSQLIVKKEV